MKAHATTIEDIFYQLRQHFQPGNLSREGVNEKPPLRSEIFSSEQMEQHAQALASMHTVDNKPAPELLLSQLSENEDVLFRVTRLLQDAVKEKKVITPAGEWLLDNYYLIEEQVRIGKRHLPRGYSKGLPRLAGGKSAGLPRVYDIAIEIISHSDGHVDISNLSHFIAAYQKVTYLTLGELWAVPIMLRLALLENLRRVAARIAVDRIDEDLADYWSQKILTTVETNPKDLVLVMADMARSNPPMDSAFVAAFTRQLQWRGADLALPISWVEQHLSESGDTIKDMVLLENQRKASNQVSMSNSINSLRFLAKTDWREFVETMSKVEEILRTDPAAVYGRMDFHSRDRYRHRVEALAKHCPMTEEQIASAAVTLCNEYVNRNGDRRKVHVGYYLLGPGIKQLEKSVRVRRTLLESLRNGFAERRGAFYFISVFLLTAIITVGLYRWAVAAEVTTGWLVAIVLLGTLAASQFAVAITNWLATMFAHPALLPKLNFSNGIPDACRTMVAVPTLLAGREQILTLLEDLEVRYLGNRDPNLLFALVTDFRDGAEAHLPEDDELVQFATEGIEQLNRKYGRLHHDTFFLFHRPRKWNAMEKKWIGYERKRGKLSDLNKLLLHGDRQHFSVVVGEPAVYTTVKYVITLDTDTQLPREAAWKMVGIMAHPLNRAVYSEKHRRVVEGYGIIQPRVAISLHGAERTGYTRMYENDSGIDPYTHAVSDVYQDVFSEGSFIGKGIYEVEIFEKALDNRFPENRILSHDLLEGSYIRCAYASDVQLYEEYPSRYTVDANRRHRWVRGDWQIGSWALPMAPDATGRWQRNPLNGLSRWKIFDNLRRSVVPLATMALYGIAWYVLPQVWRWTLCITALIILPALLISVWGVMRKPKEISLRQHLLVSIYNSYHALMHAAFCVAILAYEALYYADAVLRTIWRMLVSRRRLLQWNPSGFVQRRGTETLIDAYRAMLTSPAIAVGVCIGLWYARPEALAAAALFAVLWALAPALVWWLGKPLPTLTKEISADQRLALRELSRKTWSFFEDLVGAGDNWLPPDNLQQYPIPVIAHRTSPTNIGMALLANLSALDFGYISLPVFLQRTENTFSTMQQLERYRGHFYNWYNTQTLETLHPRYISTVDSGNLAGHLMTLRQGLLALVNRPLAGREMVEGFCDTLRLMRGDDKASQALWEEPLKHLEALLTANELSLPDIFSTASGLRVRAAQALQQLDPASDAHRWAHALERQSADVATTLRTMAPWLDLLPPTEKMKNLLVLRNVPTLGQLSRIPQLLEEAVAMTHPADLTAAEKSWLDDVTLTVVSAAQYAKELLARVDSLAMRSAGFADIDFEFLYDRGQHLLTIGYNAETNHRDSSFYDLLASEARLSTFVGIAQGKLPQESWFALGRRLTTAGTTPVLLSWSGSMFEYLMPNLVMPGYHNTLLDETARGCVQKQIEYGRQHQVPWGISESCYNVVDSQLVYQYRAFGVPGLGFKRGLAEDLVIAPYATVMALMVDPQAALRNLHELRNEGLEGRYGFFESADYTPARLPRGQSRVAIQTFMAHHQGMSLLSLAYVLLDQPMQKRFEADPQLQTALLLLQERVPQTISFASAATEMQDVVPSVTAPAIRVIDTPHTPAPEIQLLSNGRYHVMVTNAGGGYSRWNDMAVTRWREDSTCDNAGTFCYVRDLQSGALWSTAYQPVGRQGEFYAAVFSQGRVEFRRADHEIEIHTEIIVSPEDDIEIRRIHLVNRSRRKRNIELTSYAEVVLAPPVADAAHPAFSNLFVQTEINTRQQTILATRRARSHEEQPPWMVHLMKYNGEASDHISFETDRSRFIGRGHTLAYPKALASQQPLGNSEGSVLDPVVAIQHRITMEPDDAVVFDVVTGMARTREQAQLLADKYQDPHLRDRAFELSWTHSQVVLRQINATEGDAQLFNQLASAVIYANPALRASPAVLQRNTRGQSALWSYSISGDLPIVLLRISDSTNIVLVKQLVQAHAYWHEKGLAADLVIVNEDHTGYRQLLQEQIQGFIAAGAGATVPGRRGGIFIRSAEQISNEDWILLQTVARVILSDNRGSLADQLRRGLSRKVPAMPAMLQPTSSLLTTKASATTYTGLVFYNGHGGFSKDGKEYIIESGIRNTTPLPWINVLANPVFGTIVTESGPSYTWSENAHAFRLTPWYNDPVGGRAGEAFYIRDEDTGRFWSPMPYPAPGVNGYTTRHGFGYSVFEHGEEGLTTESTVFVDREAPVKFTVIRIRNRSGVARRLSVTAFVEWVLGDLREKSLLHVVCEPDGATRALMARNAYHPEFSHHVAFLDVDESTRSFTTDRTEFVGRNGNLAAPAAMQRVQLSGKHGAGYDPCAAMLVPVTIEAGQEYEIVFRMGTGKSVFEAGETIRRFRGRKAATAALDNVRKFWSEALGSVQVETPDRALNILANGWLLYQVLASRLWGRSGFYQSGGAFGFRDQLQDVLALMHVDAGLTRKQVLLAASRQFKEGDVQHWWHPPSGRGVRTMCSDDFLWLPYVTSRYVEATGDVGVLDETVAFLEGRQLNVGEESYYDLPLLSEVQSPLYDHCKRAIERGLRLGVHGLPLIGSGDWNDGMNMVGIHGQGESVWLAFFLYDVLKRFGQLAHQRGDQAFQKYCDDYARQLQTNIHENAWDGGWYLRAFYDDGTPLGSSQNEECRIDAIAQSWSVLSGAGDPERVRTAMTAADRYLIKRDTGIIQLLDPPLNHSGKDPGYIKGYVPGVRENGGQYTHAAIWTVMAFARLGNREKTWELLNMINPLNHGRTPEEIAVYKTEPYVLAADVYAVPPNSGRGGWTWYTGSAGWMYQLILEWFLGLQRRGASLAIAPCLPPEWRNVRVRYRYGKSLYHIQLVPAQAAEEVSIIADGVPQNGRILSLADDGLEHHVQVRYSGRHMGSVVPR